MKVDYDNHHHPREEETVVVSSNCSSSEEEENEDEGKDSNSIMFNDLDDIHQEQLNEHPSSKMSSPEKIIRSSSKSSLTSVSVDFDDVCHSTTTERYADKRTMTNVQEKWNAITILPSAMLCLYYLYYQQWKIGIDDGTTVEDVAKTPAATVKATTIRMIPNNLWTRCLDWPMQLLHILFPNILSNTQMEFHYKDIPPTTILALCVGIVLHCPCSFVYHWTYAPAYSDPLKRLKHWSRRLDHSAIHLCSLFWCYGLSLSSCCGGSNHYQHPYCYLLFNLIYNVDSIRCQWEEEMQPRRNQFRILGSMVLYTLPLIVFDTTDEGWQVFQQVWCLFVVSLWLFAAYPLGGWSHAAFHIVMVAVPPILLDYVARKEA